MIREWPADAAYFARSVYRIGCAGEFTQEYGQAQPDESGIRLASFGGTYCEQELLTISTFVTFMLPCSLLDFFTPVSWAMSFMSSFMLCAVELVTTPVA